jgi:hypothetical protein
MSIKQRKNLTERGNVSFYVPNKDRDFIEVCKLFSDMVGNNLSGFIIDCLREKISKLPEHNKLLFNKALSKYTELKIGSKEIEKQIENVIEKIQED